MKRRKFGQLSGADKALWDKVTDQLSPIEADLVPKLRPTKQIARRPLSERTLPLEWQALGVPEPRAHMDRKTKRRIAKGQVDIDGVLDLHGLTKEQAYIKLRRRLDLAVRHHNRCLLVITGKGGKRFSQLNSTPAAARTRSDFDQDSGILRNIVPEWLRGADCRPYVQSYTPADAAHGGDGALYVMLRKNRSHDHKRKLFE